MAQEAEGLLGTPGQLHDQLQIREQLFTQEVPKDVYAGGHDPGFFRKVLCLSLLPWRVCRKLATAPNHLRGVAITGRMHEAYGPMADA